MSQPPKVHPKPGQVKVVRALYNYSAQRPDELTFKAGEVLYVFDQTTDKDWWKARCGTKTGVIPSNYVECQTESVDAPLHEAARRGNLSFLRECLHQGVSATGLDSVGNTALHWACRGGHIECVRELLAQSNPPVNAQNKMGDSPLHLAAAHSHLEVLSLVLQAGADSGLHNNDGQTAEQLGSAAVASLLRLSRSPRARPASYTPDDYVDESD
ncbi:osteoclast-stimulating factor 1-like [Homalodisca vitripennis]|uniref:osteoclast-stimulating factor 1-like n=1 Tax=Homalodisca vitripennis TaxID=197043 RepID=UPI001EEC9925|nr:osteoclast-stimulating factor 1-like [Homalodisca vitripennis]